jgi:hypothetical protein
MALLTSAIFRFRGQGRVRFRQRYKPAGGALGLELLLITMLVWCLNQAALLGVKVDEVSEMDCGKEPENVFLGVVAAL